jgi:hypothetical protein
MPLPSSWCSCKSEKCRGIKKYGIEAEREFSGGGPDVKSEGGIGERDKAGDRSPAVRAGLAGETGSRTRSEYGGEAHKPGREEGGGKGDGLAGGRGAGRSDSGNGTGARRL